MPDASSRPSSHRLRLAMQLRGIGSGAELARLTRQNEVTVRSHVNGTRDVSKRAAEAYSRALGIDAAWLIYGHGKAPDASPPSDMDRKQPPEASESVDDPPNARLSTSEAPDFRFL